jgi:hypothetical protein
MKLPFPPFEPDRSRFNGGVIPSVLNVLPVADGWAPLPGIAEFVLSAAAVIIVDPPPDPDPDPMGALLADELAITLQDEDGLDLEDAA